MSCQSEFIPPFKLGKRRLTALEAREDKEGREGIPHTHPIPQGIRLKLFLESG